MEEVPSSAPCWSSIVKQQPPPTTQNQQVSSADRVFVESCQSTKGIAVAVVDANAIIQGGETLAKCADKFVSVSEVMDEVRDPTSRHRLNFVPFTLDTMEPSPEALKKVINFARATGDLQTLSDVDLKLIALTYTLEAQIHGTKHLRDSPPPIHTVNVKRLPEKDMPGWGSNVPNLEEWEALEHEVEDGSNPSSRILPLKDLSLNVISTDHHSTEDGSMGYGAEHPSGNQEDGDGSFRKPRRYLPKKKEINIEGKKMVSDGIDASQGQFDDNAGDWLPAVSRSTHRRYLRRKARREIYEASSEKEGQQDAAGNEENDNLEDTRCLNQMMHESSEETHVVNGNLEESSIRDGKSSGKDLSTILNQMRLDEDSLRALQEEEELGISCMGLEANNSTVEDDTPKNNANIVVEVDEVEITNDRLEHLETFSQTAESVEYTDGNSSEQSWMLRSLSDSSVACVTSDFAMQNVLLQMGLRLLAPGGMQIRQLHRWILKCHACYKVTMEVGRIFCPKCGNGGTLRKVAVTVGENGIVLSARRPRISLRGTKFSLPLPQGGRDAVTKNPILREDQLPHRLLYPKTKKKGKQGDDIFTSDYIFRHHTDKRAPLQPPIRKALAVFSGKRNPNDNHFARPKC